VSFASSTSCTVRDSELIHSDKGYSERRENKVCRVDMGKDMKCKESVYMVGRSRRVKGMCDSGYWESLNRIEA
jgi:hypothetical protein